ncbi:MAG: hypothetical protein SNJ70_03950 [Armatimonadota bacterium]
MNENEAKIREIKDRIAQVMGILNDSSVAVHIKENIIMLDNSAKELHKCADEIQNLLMRVRRR